MTTRFDVWFTNPLDGRRWWGWLITGGDNIVFRARPLPIHESFLLLETRRFKEPRIVPVSPGIFEVFDGQELLWAAQILNHSVRPGMSSHPGFLFAKTVERLLEEYGRYTAEHLLLRQSYTPLPVSELLAA